MIPLTAFLLLLLLLFPEVTAEGAKTGLVLWASTLVPALFPFSVFTSLLRRSLQGKKGQWLLLFAGLLSGYPMGAKLSGDLYDDGALSKEKAFFFIGLTNNPSPMFILYFVAGNCLHLGGRRYLFFLLLLLSSLLGSLTWLLYFRIRQRGQQHRPKPVCPASGPLSPSRQKLSLTTILDDEIAAAAALLLKIGGYVMLFSIFTAWLCRLSFIPPAVRTLLCSILEITTGNVLISQQNISQSTKIILSLAATTFGGLSAAAQCSGILQKTGLSFHMYLIVKGLNAAFAALLAFLFLRVGLLC